MKVSKRFLDKDTQSIIYVQYERGWTWEEHHAVVNDLMQSASTSDVSDNFSYVIVDWRSSTLPRNRNATVHNPEVNNNALIIIVTTDMFSRMMVQMGIKVKGLTQFCVVNSLKQAERLINADREKRALYSINLVAQIDENVA